MNKRANLYLNIFELLSFLISVCFMESYLYFHNLPLFVKSIIFLVSVLSGILFITIELFLFILLNNKSKVAYCFYMLIDLGLSVFLTIKIPYAGFYIFLLFSTIKNILRVVLVDVLYIPKEFNRYCKMFHITVSDFKKTKTKKKVKAVIEIPSQSITKEAPAKKKSVSKKKAHQEATV